MISNVLHLLLVGVWAGVILVELLVELVYRRRSEAAVVHRWIDLVLELPLIAGVVTTGALLAARAWPLTTLHWIKIGSGLVAVSFNLFCVVVVLARYRRRDDAQALARFELPIVLSTLGIPFGAVALYLGLTRFLAL